MNGDSTIPTSMSFLVHQPDWNVLIWLFSIIPSFGPLVRVYIDQFEASMLERINTSCRLPKTWIPASHQKPHWAEGSIPFLVLCDWFPWIGSNCYLVEKWTDECVGAISLLRKLKFLQKYDQALPLPYLKQFAETLGRIWTTLQEIVYNLFIDEFPVEQRNKKIRFLAKLEF